MICLLLTVCGHAAIILFAAVAVANPLPPDIPFLDFLAFPLPAAVAPSPTTDEPLFAFTNFELESPPVTLMAAAEPTEEQLSCSQSGNTGSGNKQRRGADGEAACPTNDSPPGQIMPTTSEKDEIPDFVPQFGQIIDGVPVLFDQYKSKKCPNPKYPLHFCCDGPLGPYVDIYLHWLEVENCIDSEFTHSILCMTIFCVLFINDDMRALQLPMYRAINCMISAVAR